MMKKPNVIVGIAFKASDTGVNLARHPAALHTHWSNENDGYLTHLAVLVAINT
jgi:hypothetical protein